MTSAIKAEFRKLLTVRSTYLLFGLAMLLVAFFAGYVFGYRAEGTDLNDVHRVNDSLLGMPPIVAIFASVIAVLLAAHEYRYSTIVYTLTATNSRTKVLFAKVFALTVFSFIFSMLACILLVIAMYAGVAIAGHSLAGQELFLGDLFWRINFYIWGNVMTGLLFGVLFRNLVAAIVGIFIIPDTVEALLGLALKDNVKYLPFHSLGQVLSDGPLSSQKSALLFLAYLAAFGAVAWILFARRDAN